MSSGNGNKPYPNEEDLSAFLDGELTADEQAAMADRMANDADGPEAQALERLRRVDALYSDAPRARAPGGFEERVQEALRQSEPVRLRGRDLPRQRVWPMLAAAAVFLVLVGGTILLATSPRDFAATSDVASRADPNSAENRDAPLAGATDDGQRTRETAPPPASPSALSEPIPAPEPMTDTKAQGRPQAELESRFEPEEISPPAARDEAASADTPQPSPAQDSVPALPFRAETAPTGQRRAEGRDASGLGGGGSGAADTARGARPEAFGAPGGPARHVGDRVFRYVEGAWLQQGAAPVEPETLKPDSEAWRALLESDPSLARLAGWTEPVTFRLDTNWYRLEPAGPASEPLE